MVQKLGSVASQSRAPRVIVAQSSALMRDCAPLYTCKQFLARWRGAEMDAAQVSARLLADAGLDDAEGKQAHGAALEALLGGDGASVQVRTPACLVLACLQAATQRAGRNAATQRKEIEKSTARAGMELTGPARPASLQLAAQVETLAAVLLGVARQGERGLVLCVEARLPPRPTPFPPLPLPPHAS